MSSSTNAVSTELDAVNQILSSVGQAPVTTLNLQNPEVSIALNTLREVNRMVQSEGWTFNTEHGITLTPDINKEILFPRTALSIDTNKEFHGDDYSPVRREGKLYNKYTHSFEWEAQIIADIIWLIPFEDSPPALQAYVIARAARMACVKMIGDSELYKLLQEQEGLARSALIEYETNQGDYSMFGFNDGYNYYNSYQPYKALLR